MEAEELVKYYERLKSDKAVFDVLYQDIADFFLPYSGDFNAIYGKGENRQRYLISQDAQHALDISASSLIGLVANPATRWMYLELQDEELNRDVLVQEYLDRAGQTLLNYINNPDSMFYAHLKTAFMETLAYGTPTMMVRYDKEEDMFRFKTLPLCKVVIAEDVNEVVDVVIYEREMTYRQLLQKKDDWDLHADCLKKAKENPFEETTVLFCYMPREGGTPDTMSKEKMPYAEYVIDKTHNHMMYEDGFYESPVRTARWFKLPDEVYGRSPAMIASADVRTLNEATKLFYDTSEKNANPAMFIPDDGRMGNKINLTAGSVNFYDASKGNIQFVTGTGDVNVLLAAIESLKENIRSLMYVDQLQLQGSATMTATEVMQRVDEKTRLLAPSLGRLQSELVSPIILRALNILIRNNRLPPLPEKLVNQNIKVIYGNQVNRAQRSGEVQNVIAAAGYIGQMAQFSPQVLDNVDLDKTTREIMDMMNVTASMAKDEEEVEKIRAQAAQAAKMQQMMQGAEQAGGAMEQLGKGLNAIQGGASP